MSERITSRRAGAGHRSPFNWLRWLDEEVGKFQSSANWLEHIPFQLARCRLFMMARFADLPRPFPDPVISDELSRGESLIRNSAHAERILRDLKPDQRNQLAGLLLDVTEALKFYARHRRSAKSISKLAAERNRRERMLLGKVARIRGELKRLLKYAEDLHPLLSLEYVQAAKHCLKSLANLKEDPSDDEFYRSLKNEHPPLEDPWQLGLVQGYWFFRWGCGCSGHDSEVRVAMVANECWIVAGKRKLKYSPKYLDAESQGCSAVRLAVSRYHPRTSD